MSPMNFCPHLWPCLYRVWDLSMTGVRFQTPSPVMLSTPVQPEFWFSTICSHAPSAVTLSSWAGFTRNRTCVSGLFSLNFENCRPFRGFFYFFILLNCVMNCVIPSIFFTPFSTPQVRISQSSSPNPRSRRLDSPVTQNKPFLLLYLLPIQVDPCDLRSRVFINLLKLLTSAGQIKWFFFHWKLNGGQTQPNKAGMIIRKYISRNSKGIKKNLVNCRLSNRSWMLA